MLRTATRRRSMLAVASVTAGVASVVAAPSAANAQPADPEVEFREWGQQADPAERPAAGLTSLGVCGSFSAFDTPFSNTIFRPTISRDDQQANCELVEGAQTEGVFKLKDTLTKCYGLDPGPEDTLYSNQTTMAVKRVQEFHDLQPTGQFGPETSAAMFWPEYNAEDGFAGFCSNPVD